MPSRYLAPVNEPLTILLVEDDPGDVLIAQEAFAAGGLATRVHVVSDGVEALAFLRREAEHTGAPIPDLLLVDLNLPRMSGHELLTEVKGNAAWRSIPVAVLTTSRSEEDVARSYDLQANVHVSKPSDFEESVAVVTRIDEFFGRLAELPGRA